MGNGESGRELGKKDPDLAELIRNYIAAYNNFLRRFNAEYEERSGAIGSWGVKYKDFLEGPEMRELKPDLSKFSELRLSQTGEEFLHNLEQIALKALGGKDYNTFKEYSLKFGELDAQEMEIYLALTERVYRALLDAGYFVADLWE